MMQHTSPWKRRSLISLISILGFLTCPAFGEPVCKASSFQNLELPGGKILDISTKAHTNLSFQAPAEQNHYATAVTDLNACEVIITYTHPGSNDTIHTVVWLPSPEKWTGRLLGAGGGGWAAGPETNTTLPWAASEGFVTVATDGGHIGQDISWSLTNSGKVDWVLLEDLASISLDDAATLGKAVIHSYYGKAPSYSYWNGCSQGGRQGYMMAQKYPNQYDGILAVAPAIYWNELMMQLFWPQVVMNENGFPTPQEFEAINVAVAEACDGLDGLEDGIILAPQDCTFDPMTVVGKQYLCPSTNQSMTITNTLAKVAKLIWQGATTPESDFLWYPGNIGASFVGLASTTCSKNNSCVGVPFAVPQTWITDFVIRDREYDTARMNITYFEQLFHDAVARYDSVIGTANTDLDGFRKAGGKLLSWHGLADMAIAPDATAHYAQQVHERDPNSSDYYRYFEAPGVDHCGGGLGWYPGDSLKTLIDWVEKGAAPEVLEAETTQGRKAQLCLWPKHMVYVGENPDEAASFECR
ncbi:hypothetical protein J4E85_002845 [Alternaria conjuncta]|uniref:uncharacterized protein n=1 Tax=Alternaria conjuncta TaxID=181017 RepID=UPI00221FA5EF|nr:uncharacterized protein J4E85_002845 [Alternaria conjuncta]KAI4932447.1 hypothetical protein J4E85_002845 [Alternaria conjuncta]